MVQDDFFDGGAVVSLLPQRADARFPAVQTVRAYWEALRNGRDAPFRSEIDPRGIESALENTFILERIAPRLARFRLAGTHLNDLIGMEVRGMPLTSFFTPGARGEIEAILSRVFDGPETAELTLVAEAGTGRAGIEARMILLPLRSDLGDVSRALGCLVAPGAAGLAPQRFAIASARTAPPAGRWPARQSAGPAAASGFAEPPHRFTPPPPPGAVPRRRPQLRLVTTERD